MGKVKFDAPTQTELEILGILWKNGASPVSVIHQHLAKKKSKKVVYTTTLKFLQIMLDKGLVTRDSSLRAHVYSPSVDHDLAQKHYLEKIVDVVFSGSAFNLVLQAIGNEELTDNELDKIKQFISEKEKKS